MDQLFDLAVIGGGVNGAGIARDAAGRGAKVLLLEAGDLAQGTSSASTKLIHGGLRYLEHYEFGLVRESLSEREALWAIAPHIIHPMRFVLPYVQGLRPRWLLRLGLFLYDHIGGRKRLPATRTIDLQRHPAGTPLKPGFTAGFEYSDGWVDDARLVLLNAKDAAERGAEVRTRTKVTGATRVGEVWAIATSGGTFRAKALVNAAGPQVLEVENSLGDAPDYGMRLVRGSHIVVRKLFEHPYAYFFQLADGRIFFAIPYERDFTLIGTVGHVFKGDPAIVAMAASDVAYLCDAANRYFRERIEVADVVRTVSGVNMVMNPASKRPARDGATNFDYGRRKAPLLTIFGGDVTTSRLRAEKAVSKLSPFYPMSARWTAKAPLPGGNFAFSRFENEVDEARARWRFLSEDHARRLVGAYGLNVKAILGEASDRGDLGPAFGPELTGAEVRYLMEHEWARFPDDILWRRTKLGLTMPPADREALAKFMATASP